MSFKDNQRYPKDKIWSDTELYAITPRHIARWLKKKAYGTPDPGPEDGPVHACNKSLLFAKKAVSFFHLNKNMPWNKQARQGNPTRSLAVNAVIEDVKKQQVRKRGKVSQAKRDLRRSELKKTLQLAMARRDFIGKYRTPAMLKLQTHIIGRADDACQLETADLRNHNLFADFCLETKVSWSKNVREERECPAQILIGANDPDFCVLLALAAWLENRATHGGENNQRFLFGAREDDDEGARINEKYGAVLREIWETEEFRALSKEVLGGLGTHSVRKFAAT